MNPTELGLPHRPPFVFVDEISEIDPGVSARGAISFEGTEPFFEGHFPGDPIVPGVLLTEAQAQVAGIAGAASKPGSRLLLSAVRLMKFHRPVRPGERIELAAVKTGEIGGLLRFDTSASVDGTFVAEGQIVLSRANGIS